MTFNRVMAIIYFALFHRIR